MIGVEGADADMVENVVSFGGCCMDYLAESRSSSCRIAVLLSVSTLVRSERRDSVIVLLCHEVGILNVIVMAFKHRCYVGSR